ncbi:MAG TPA: type II restriction endonuclease subunit M, partial [Verrucomicrobiae bacterium]|nr:type II restriction endonuclease subunit M [Verrucomicrobiae bacterium]
FRKPAGFFADHLKRYSKSRRQAPIYWPLSTASGSYTLWIYYHRLNDDTLFKCIQKFVEPKLADVEKELAHLRSLMDSGEGSTKTRRQLDEAEQLRTELKEMRAELEHWAPRWKPNLNDGVLITACPLWKLFRLPKWRRDLEACWKELERGDYDWAHLAYTLWPDRVREKCKTDRSLAIGHGLEELCEVNPAAKKVRKGKSAKAEEAQELIDYE